MKRNAVCTPHRQRSLFILTSDLLNSLHDPVFDVRLMLRDCGTIIRSVTRFIVPLPSNSRRTSTTRTFRNRSFRSISTLPPTTFATTSSDLFPLLVVIMKFEVPECALRVLSMAVALLNLTEEDEMVYHFDEI